MSANKTQPPINLTNNCNAVYDNELLVEAMLWFACEPTRGNKKVFMHGKYPAVAIGRHKLHIHRLMMAYLNGGLERYVYVHHIDENKLNATISNLELLDASTHQRITNLGRKQTPEWIKKRIDATSRTRYGIYENPELLKKEKTNG